MRQQLLRRITQGSAGSLSYFLLESTKTSEDGVTYRHYGISIEEGDGQAVESVFDVSLSREDTQRLIDMLADGGAYPVHLKDIVSDWLA